MDRNPGETTTRALLAGALSLAIAGVAQAQSPPANDAARIGQLEARVQAQDRQIEAGCRCGADPGMDRRVRRRAQRKQAGGAPAA